MSDNLANLGTSVVLDAHQMNVGDHIFMGNDLCIITEINGERVVVQPVVGWELLKYRLLKHRILVSIAVLAVAAVIIYFGWKH